MRLDGPSLNLPGWSLGPRTKVGLHTLRVAEAAETAARLAPLCRRVPITRVSNLTPLDPLALPVFGAVTPLARDLTTHLGKGFDETTARVSALMEAIERPCAEGGHVSALRCSLDAWTRGAHKVRAGTLVMDPRHCDLPAGTSFRPDSPISWVEGNELLSGSSMWAALDLVVSPPREGVLLDVNTNGLASGNTLLEAIVHGLCEVVERDAVSQHLFADLYGQSAPETLPCRRIDTHTLPPQVGRWVRRLEEHHLVVSVSEITSDIAVPTFRATLLDPAFPAETDLEGGIFFGYGCGPSTTLAVGRAVTEAVQSRLGVIQGARDSFNEIPLASPSTANPLAPSVGGWRDLQPGPRLDFADVASHETLDLADDLAFILRRLQTAGFEQVFAADLTRPDLGVPVVRVIIPGLSIFVGNRERVGWRCLRHLL